LGCGATRWRLHALAGNRACWVQSAARDFCNFPRAAIATERTSTWGGM